ncbi:MAG: DUF1573 domain-containing protein [Phycisphaerae bacterium]|jgi:hypothetical protein
MTIYQSLVFILVTIIMAGGSVLGQDCIAQSQHSISISTQPTELSHACELLGKDKLLPIRWSGGCGIDSLFLCLRLVGCDVDYMDLVRKANITEPGQWIDLNTLYQIARQVGGYALAVRISPQDEGELKKLLKVSPPRTAILHLQKVDNTPEHLICVYLNAKGELRVAGAKSFEYDEASAWKRRWSGVALLIASTPFRQMSTTSGAVGQLHVNTVEYDAGQIASGATFAFNFQVRNLGQGPLHLERIYSSCNCTTIKLTTEWLNPGESIDIRGTVDAGATAGRHEAKLVVLSNDPERPRADLRLTWEIEPPLVEFSPASVTTRVAERGQNVCVTLKSRFSKAGTNLQDFSIVSSQKWVNCSLDDKLQLILTVVPTWSSGQCTAEVVVTPKKGSGKVVIPVVAEVLPPIVACPQELLFQKDKDGQYAQRVVQIKANHQIDSFDIKRAELRGLTGAIVMAKATPCVKTFTVKIQPPADKGEKFFEGQIVMELSGTDVTELVIPIYVMQ